MKMRFTIGKKIGSGFGILVLLTLIVFVITYFTVQQSREINDKINTVSTPSIKALDDLRFSILNSRLLLETWVKHPKDHEDKQRLLKYHEINYPKQKQQLIKLSESWEYSRNDSLVEEVFATIDQLIVFQQEEVIEILPDFESYDDFILAEMATYSMTEGGNIYETSNEVLGKLDILIEDLKMQAKDSNVEMFESFEKLKMIVVRLGIALVLIGIFIGALTTKTIVNPIVRLKKVAVKLGRGVFPDSQLKVGNDEIGEMTAAMNNVVKGLKGTKDFATEIGSGHFETEYTPLSNKDSLGIALLKMRDDLAENERILEEKVRLRTAEVVAQSEEIDEQKAQIEEYFTQVTDSIKYAQKIQEAILPPENQVKELIPNSFIFYRPKDIVSGDFYWLGQAKNKVFFAAVDCTGHGVPGAFMSIIGYNQLKQAITTVADSSPAKILDYLNRGVTETLHQADENSSNRDGMDIAICSLDYDTLELEYAGAFNPLYLLRNGEIIQTKGDKFPIGSFIEGETANFTNNSIQLEKGDQVYIFSDGYADQFGGPKGKKFMYSKFRQLLSKNCDKSLIEQEKILEESLSNWMGDEEQVDDILVIGVKV